MSVATYTKTGNKSTSIAKLDKAVFYVEVTSHQLLKQAYDAYLANGRINLAKTKTRGEVRGGGRKPWRQKGTGRARFGSSRNPIWTGGGVTFGPTGNENYNQKLTTKAKRQALRQALSLAAKESRLSITEGLESKEGKVSDIVKVLNKIGATGNVLLVVDNKDDLFTRATNNLANVKATQATYLNVYDLVNADAIIMTTKALELVNSWLGTKKPVAKELVS